MTMPVKREIDTPFDFGGFTLDLKRRGLYRGGERIHLTSKPLEVLIFLVHNRGRVVEKRELIDAVWNGVFVTDDNLVQAIIEIRRALKDNKNDPHFIETVPRQGYRFLAEVPHESSPLEFPTPTTTPSGIHEIQKVPKHPLLSKVIGNPKKAALIVSGLVILPVGVALVYMLFLQDRSGAGSDMPFETVKFTRITTSGKVAGATISPDGRYVLYALRSEGQESLWLQQVATASDVQVTKPTDVLHQGLTFSPDGNSFCYVVRDKNQLGELYQMPMLGGVPKKLIADVDSTITFSPDGKQISFFRGYPEKSEDVLVIANADGTQPKELAIRKRPDFFPTLLNAAPAWSPGTAVIACPAGSADATGRYMTVVEVKVASGTIDPVTSRRWWYVGHIAWLRDGSGLIIVAKERASDPSQLWHLSYHTGEARRITNDLNDYVGASLTRESPPSLVTVQSDVLSSISTAPAEGDAIDISIGSAGGLPGLCWTPDGRIVYAARLKGNLDIYVMEKEGSNQKQLTADAGDNHWPSVSPDGRYIVFMSSRTGRSQIWRMNLDGSNLKQLTSGSEARWPRCAPDSQWVAYVSLSNPVGLFKVSIEGTDVVQLTDKTSTYPAISPDGKLIATGYREDPGADKTAIYSFDAGALLKVLNFSSSFICWKPDGSGLTYIDQNRRNIVGQPTDSGSPVQLTRFKDGAITAFDWSHDGRLACSRKVVIADAVIISSVDWRQGL
jgi:Tol biopolymer transport system component/DNA-binding winged helix-turn-helix (wHTH) protein